MNSNKKEDLIKLYNELQELWWQKKHDNNASIDGVKGYEHVDVAANYLKMQVIEEIMKKVNDLIEA